MPILHLLHAGTNEAGVRNKEGLVNLPAVFVVEAVVHRLVQAKVQVHAAQDIRTFQLHILPAVEGETAAAGLGLHEGGNILERDIHVVVHRVLPHGLG